MKLNNLPIIAILILIQITKLILHFRIMLYQVDEIIRSQNLFILTLFLAFRIFLPHPSFLQYPFSLLVLLTSADLDLPIFMNLSLFLLHLFPILGLIIDII